MGFEKVKKQPPPMMKNDENEPIDNPAEDLAEGELPSGKGGNLKNHPKGDGPKGHRK